MPSPFPGMDPYLEESSIWSEFHSTIIVHLRAALNATLPARYTAHVDRYVWLEEADTERLPRDGKPDVYLTDRETSSNGGTATLTAPAIVYLPAVRRQGPRYIRIVDRQRGRVVTVIEILSPTNKDAGPDHDAYLTKRNEYLATQTNLIEIDLLRAGPRLPLGDPAPPMSDYCILVSPASNFPQAGVWPFGVRDSIPQLQVPLGSGDPPISLDLKPCMDRAYDEGKYRTEINYTQLPVPPLREPDAAWARQLLAGQALSGDLS